MFNQVSGQASYGGMPTEVKTSSKSYFQIFKVGNGNNT